MKVLIAIEDKKFGEVIAKFVAEHRWFPETEFKLLHAVEGLMGEDYLAGAFAEEAKNLLEERMRRGRSLVLSIGSELRQAFPTAKIAEEVIEGVPKSVIINTAKSWQADIIVMGSHGKTGISQFLLGSVSLSVLAQAPCSVMIVRAMQKNATAEERSLETAGKH